MIISKMLLMTKLLAALGALILTTNVLNAQLVLLSNSRSVAAYSSAAAGTERYSFGFTNRAEQVSTVFSGSSTSNTSAYSSGGGPDGLDVSAYARSRASQ